MNSTGDGMLHVAAMLGHVEICEYFLSLGADPDSPNFYGRTALHKAIEANQLATSRVCCFLAQFFGSLAFW